MTVQIAIFEVMLTCGGQEMKIIEFAYSEDLDEAAHHELLH